MPLHSPEQTGLPSPTEDAELAAIEDAIRGLLQEQAESLLVAVITTSGMREFVLYTRAPEVAEKRFEQLRTRIVTHQIQLMIQLDNDWDVYAQLG